MWHTVEYQKEWPQNYAQKSCKLSDIANASRYEGKWLCEHLDLSNLWAVVSKQFLLSASWVENVFKTTPFLA